MTERGASDSLVKDHWASTGKGEPLTSRLFFFEAAALLSPPAPPAAAAAPAVDDDDDEEAEEEEEEEEALTSHKGTLLTICGLLVSMLPRVLAVISLAVRAKAGLEDEDSSSEGVEEL